MESLPREEFGKRIDEFLLAVGPETGQFINMLVKVAGARHIVEVGTSHGYSTIWLAEAANLTGGRVTTLDLHAGKQAFAKDALAEVGLGDRVDFVLGDALETLRAGEGPVDFVLLDIWKTEYIPCFDLLVPRMAPGGIVVADNILYPESMAETMKAYQAHVRGTPGVESMLVPVGNGLELTRFAG